MFCLGKLFIAILNNIRPRKINLWNSGSRPRHLIVALIDCFLLHFPALLVFILSTHALFISQDISQIYILNNKISLVPINKSF